MALVHDTVKHPAMCAQRLVTEALARGGADNVACLVAFLNTGGATGGGGRAKAQIAAGSPPVDLGRAARRRVVLCAGCRTAVHISREHAQQQQAGGLARKPPLSRVQLRTR